MIVYLAGGMHGYDWRAEVTERTDFEILDPRSCKSTDPAEYTAFDLRCIRDCDAIIAYLEPDNPSGVGLALEIGYAVALGKLAVFVDGQPHKKRFDIVRNAAAVCVPTIQDAIRVVK